MLQLIHRPYLVVTMLALLCVAFATFAEDSIAHIQQQKKNLQHDKFIFRLHATATLSNITLNGLKISELSGLVWDPDEKLLYALSDNGYVLHMRPEFKDHVLQDIKIIAGHHLLDEKGKALKYKQADSEGLSIEHGDNGKHGDTQLIVSFERIPRLVRYHTDGTIADLIALPLELADVSRYRGENKALEAVAVHPALGILIGTEAPLKNLATGSLNIYSLHNEHWSFPAYNSSIGALVDMVTLPDGKIIALERVYKGLFSGIQTTLHRVILNEKGIQTDRIYTFNPDDGLFNDNFEGIAHLGDNYFMMVSDDNNHPLKRTLLVYFEIIEGQ